MKHFLRGPEFPSTTFDEIKPIILKPEMHKPIAFCEWAGIAWENLFKAIYGVTLKLEIGEGQFECSSDFIVCVNTNRILTTLLEKKVPGQKLRICVIGDCVGGTVNLTLAGLAPDNVCVVSFQNEKDNTRLKGNINRLFDVASVNFKKRKISHKYLNACVHVEPQSFTEYESEEGKKKILQSPCSLHNRLSWEFMKWCPENFIFDVIHFEVPWNLKVQKDMLTLKKKMESQSREENFNIPFQFFENDLKFFEHEASHFDTIKNMDSFFLCDMEERNITSNFIVVNIRGKLTDEEWKRLDGSGSLLTKKYQVIYQIEQIPNERIERLKYNYETKEFDRVIEKLDLDGRDPMIEARDLNGGIRGKIIIVIFKKSKSGIFYDLKSTCKYIPYKDLYEKWYGTYMNTRDSAKRGLFVEKSTHEILCEKMQSGRSKVRIFSECVGGHSELKKFSENKFTVIPARKRRIEVQIEDLKSLLRECTVFVEELKSGILIPPQRYERMKHNIAHGEYSYKYNDCCISQAEKRDTAERKQFGDLLIKQKTELYHEVHHIMKAIEEHCHWKMEAVVKHPDKFEPLPLNSDVYKRRQKILEMNDSKVVQRKRGCTMKSNLQLITQSRPMTIGGTLYCFDKDYDSDSDYDDLWEQEDYFNDRDDDDFEAGFFDKLKDIEDAKERSKNDRNEWRDGQSEQKGGGGKKSKRSGHQPQVENNNDFFQGGDSNTPDAAKPKTEGPDKDGFTVVKHKNGKKARQEKLTDEAIKAAFKRSEEGQYFQKIIELGFRPRDLQGFGVITFQELYKVAIAQHELRLQTNRQEYFAYELILERGISPREVHTWWVNNFDLEKIYNEIVEEQTREAEKEMRERDQKRKEIQEEQIDEESENYYKKKLEQAGAKLDDEEYNGKSFKDIYLIVVKKYALELEPFKRKKIRVPKKKDPTATKDNDEIQEIQPEQPNWQHTVAPSKWGKAQQEVNDNNSNSEEPAVEAQREEKKTYDQTQTSRFVEHRTKRQIYNHQDKDGNLYKDLVDFMYKLDEDLIAQETDPKAAWKKYLQRKRQKQNIESNPQQTEPVHGQDIYPQPKSQESTVYIPSQVANSIFDEDFQKFVISNKEQFGFPDSNIQPLKNNIIKPFKTKFGITRTIQLHDFDPNQVLTLSTIDHDCQYKIINFIKKVQNDNRFKKYVRGINPPKTEVPRFVPDYIDSWKWYENFRDFVLENISKLPVPISVEQVELEFLTYFHTIDYTVDLWEFDFSYIVECLDEDRTYDTYAPMIEFFEKMLHNKDYQRCAREWRPYYQTPESITRSEEVRISKLTDIVVAGCDWFDDIEDFFGYNYSEFGFSYEMEARKFAHNVDLRHPEELLSDSQDNRFWFFHVNEGTFSKTLIETVLRKVGQILKDSKFIEKANKYYESRKSRKDEEKTRQESKRQHGQNQSSESWAEQMDSLMRLRNVLISSINDVRR